MMETIRATYDGSDLRVIERTARLPETPPDSDFLEYVAFLALNGWKAVSASFEKHILTLNLERMSEIPHPTMAVYTLQTLCQSPARSFRSLIYEELHDLTAELAAAAERKGWQVLATSQPISRRGGFSLVLSLWTHNSPIGSHKPANRATGAG